jgi:hypothetical protein
MPHTAFFRQQGEKMSADTSMPLGTPQRHQFMFRTRCKRCDTMMVTDDTIHVGLPDSPERDELLDAFREGTASFVHEGPFTMCDPCRDETHKAFINCVLNALDQFD